MLPVTRNARLGALTTHDPFAGAALESFVPLSDPQREVWLACQMEPAANLAYNEGLQLTLSGTLDVPALTGALQTLVDRHESLRGTISPDGRSMAVLARLPLDLPVHDYTLHTDPAKELAKASEAEMRRAFDLENGPLVRFTLVRESETVHHLLFVAHHIVCDGWSSAVLLTELAALYSAAVRSESFVLPPAPRYGDYAVLEEAFLHSAEGRAHEAYWLAQLQGVPSPIDLPASKPRPRQRSYEASRVDVPLHPELVARLRAVGAKHNASLVATVLAGYAALLHKLTGATDMVIGLAAAGQALHDQPKLVGHCVNLLPLRLKPTGATPFADFLAATRTTVLDAFDHQGTTFGSLLPKLDLVRDESRPPLVNVLFNIDVRDDDIRHEGLAVRYETLVRRGENFELFVNAVDDGKGLLLEASYNAGLFTEGDIRARLAELTTLLAAVVEAPATTLAALPWLPPERLARADGFNATDASLPAWTVAERIAALAAEQPSAVAVQARDATLTYAALDARAATLAAHLHQAGVRAGDTVGVCLARSSELVASLLAVLKLGAVFVPLDPEVPSERIAYCLADARVALLVTDAASRAQASGGASCPIVQVEDVAASAEDATFTAATVASDAPAYVIYTSGSTGRPKGVVASHRGFVNVLASWNERLRVVPEDRIAAVASVGFDMAIVDLWAPLVAGATLVLLDRDTARDGELLAQALVDERVNVMQATPATWRLLVQSGWAGAPGFRLVTGGEALPRDLADALLARATEVWNGYGPTETTVYATLYRLPAGDAPILIGSPLANTRCHVLGAERRAVAPGTAGELWIGGAGLSLGYLHQPELTARAFVVHPELGLLYRSGDLVRLEDGGLAYLGRNDDQIKVRGYRIEPGEIEHALMQLAGVREAVVQKRDKADGDARLVAWVGVRDAAAPPTAGELRQGLRKTLPNWMVPSEFVVLDALPRLASGKLDRQALPDPFAVDRGAEARTQRKPEGAVELAVAGVWAEVLGIPVERIGADDRFFDLGGHSLLATRAAARLRERFATKLPLRSLMMDPLALVAASLPTASASAPTAPAAEDFRSAERAGASGLGSAPAAGAGSASDLGRSDDAPIPVPTPSPAAARPRTSWLGRLIGNG